MAVLKRFYSLESRWLSLSVFTVTSLVAKSEDCLNLDIFNDPNAVALNQEALDLHHMGEEQA